MTLTSNWSVDRHWPEVTRHRALHSRCFDDVLLTCLDADVGSCSQAMQPDLILKVEVDELHINAGLQDRVVQVRDVVCSSSGRPANSCPQTMAGG